MSNVTLVKSSNSVRPFTFGPIEQGAVTTTIVQPSQAKHIDSIYANYQAFLTATATSASATIVIQGTNDLLTAHGLTMPVLLTNSSTSVTIPTAPYQMNVLDATGNPTAARTIATSSAATFTAVPVDRGVALITSVYGEAYPTSNMVPLVAGMSVTGVPGLMSGATINTIASITNPTTLVLTAAFSGTTGVYLVTFSNNYWATTALGTITFTSIAGLTASDGFTITTGFKYARANVTVLSGTNATVEVWQAA